MAHAALLAFSASPCIQGSGNIVISQYQTCTWVTPNGSTAVLTITNAGPDLLTIVISGAPATIYATDGSQLNGQHVIPANAPTENVTAFANFEGRQVMIFNMSATATDARVVTSVPQGC